MCRMMQGAADVGTASGLRNRLGVSEMGAKTGTTNDNSDAWFFGYTPQLLAGVWIGCDDRFIRLESGLGFGGRAALPIWEYFFQKSLADKTLGLDKQIKFVQPENMKNDQMYDYMNIIDKTPPPGAEGIDAGNGNASEYMDTTTQKVPIDSKLTPDEQNILQEAKKENEKKKDQQVVDKLNAAPPPEAKKEKKGFFKKLFGGKDKEKKDGN
jgi:penicillin-binding protein 1A